MCFFRPRWNYLVIVRLLTILRDPDFFLWTGLFGDGLMLAVLGFDCGCCRLPAGADSLVSILYSLVHCSTEIEVLTRSSLQRPQQFLDSLLQDERRP